MKWVTRAYVHLDRVASPWLIVRFIDPQAQFEFVPWGEEASRSTDAIGFALPGATYGPHDAQGTTFAKLRRAHHLDDPALVTLEQVIGHGVEYVLHGFRPAADDRLGQIAVGLLAIAEGLLLTHRDDNAIIAQSLPPTGRHVAGKTLREQQWFFRAWLTQEFGEQLARMINKKRLSIHQVAVRADMPRKTIHAILEGDRIAFNEAADVALAFGCYLDISIKPIAGYRGAKKPKKKAR